MQRVPHHQMRENSDPLVQSSFARCIIQSYSAASFSISVRMSLPVHKGRDLALEKILLHLNHNYKRSALVKTLRSIPTLCSSSLCPTLPTEFCLADVFLRSNLQITWELWKPTAKSSCTTATGSQGSRKAAQALSALLVGFF